MKHTVTEKTLANGLRILYIDIPDTKSFDVSIAINSGSRFASRDDVTKYEIPHVLEHLVFDGSRRYPESDDLQAIFSSGGGEYNGMTTPYHNIFLFHNRLANAEPIMRAGLDMVFFPRLSETSFTEEYRVIENELTNNLGDFFGNATAYTLQQILPDFPSSVDSQLNRLPACAYEDIAPYHAKFYTLANTTVIIACDLSVLQTGTIEEWILDVTAKARKGTARRLPKFKVAKATPETSVPVRIHKTLDDTVSSTMFIRPGTLSQKDLLTLSLFATIATNMKSYSVTHKLRKQGLVYGVDFSVSQSIESYGLELDISAHKDKYVVVYAYTLGELRNLAQKGIGDREFEEARRDLADSFDDKTSSADGIIGWYAQDYIMEGSLATPEDFARMVSEVSQEEMLRLVNGIFRYEYLYQTVFSAKSIRASVSINDLAKDILQKKLAVTDALIAKRSLPIGRHDVRFVRTMYALMLTLLAVYLAPLIVLQWTSSLSGVFIRELDFPWNIVAPVYFGLLLIMPIIYSGKELRKALAQMLFVFTAWMVIIAGFRPGVFGGPFASENVFVMVQAYALVTVLAATFGVAVFGLVRMWTVAKNQR